MNSLVLFDPFYHRDSDSNICSVEWGVRLTGVIVYIIARSMSTSVLFTCSSFFCISRSLVLFVSVLWATDVRIIVLVELFAPFSTILSIKVRRCLGTFALWCRRLWCSHTILREMVSLHPFPRGWRHGQSSILGLSSCSFWRISSFRLLHRLKRFCRLGGTQRGP